MKINLLAFGIAKEIVGNQTLDFELEEGLSVGQFKQQLIDQFPDFSKLRSLKLAVNGSYVEDELIIQSNDEVVIIPPVSGG